MAQVYYSFIMYTHIETKHAAMYLYVSLNVFFMLGPFECKPNYMFYLNNIFRIIKTIQGF